MVQRLQIQDHALNPLAEVVHDIDSKDEKFSRSETQGFKALLNGKFGHLVEDVQALVDKTLAYFGAKN
jgi:hypothetical protein